MIIDKVAFSEQDMEVSVFELIEILNKVVSKRRYIEKFDLFINSLFIFIYFRVRANKHFVTCCRK